MSSGDTGFIMLCSALVFLMTPGLAFFYGGLVRRKNVVNTMMACIGIMGLSIVMWVLFGYSLSFGGNHAGIIGDFRYFAFQGVGADPGPYADTIPHLVFAGFLAALGSVDFAGGNVVHISSGVSALVLAICLGRRRGYEHTSYRIHNIPFVTLGASLLWFGWFGFNAGSALAADGLAAHAFMTSAIASASAMLIWMLIDYLKSKKTTLVGASTGLVVGLVAITPGAGFVPIWSSFLIGALVSPICYFTVVLLKQKLKIDDALDAFGCHGIGGIWGGIATGLFGKTSVNSVARWNGLVFGDFHLFTAQLISILVTIAVAVCGTLICIGIVRIFTPLRVDVSDEISGLDFSQHGENAYPSFNGFDS